MFFGVIKDKKETPKILGFLSKNLPLQKILLDKTQRDQIEEKESNVFSFQNNPVNEGKFREKQTVII